MFRRTTRSFKKFPKYIFCLKIRLNSIVAETKDFAFCIWPVNILDNGRKFSANEITQIFWISYRACQFFNTWISLFEIPPSSHVLESQSPCSLNAIKRRVKAKFKFVVIYAHVILPHLLKLQCDITWKSEQN